MIATKDITLRIPAGVTVAQLADLLRERGVCLQFRGSKKKPLYVIRSEKEASHEPVR